MIGAITAVRMIAVHMSRSWGSEGKFKILSIMLVKKMIPIDVVTPPTMNPILYRFNGSFSESTSIVIYANA